MHDLIKYIVAALCWTTVACAIAYCTVHENSEKVQCVIVKE